MRKICYLKCNLYFNDFLLFIHIIIYCMCVCVYIINIYNHTETAQYANQPIRPLHLVCPCCHSVHILLTKPDAADV